jgi:uncharacterized protein YjdB
MDRSVSLRSPRRAGAAALSSTRRFASSIAVAALIVLAAACKETTEVAQVADVIVTPPTVTLAIGQTQQLNATPVDAEGGTVGNRAIHFGTSHPTVATVSETGLVSAVAPGQATISAGAGGKNGESIITVIPPPISSVTLLPAGPRTLRVTNSYQLTATARDGNNAPLVGRTITWTSSNSSVATVAASDPRGTAAVVTAISPGTASITAESEGRQASTQITVTLVPATVVTITPSTHSMFAGTQKQFAVALRDSAGNSIQTAGHTVTWTSSNLPVATVVAQSGVVTAVSPGQATISATVDQATGTAQLTVSAVPIASVSISPPSLSLKVGTSVRLTATLSDAVGNTLGGRVIKWTSSNSSIATVNPGGVVSGVAIGGPVTITATAEGVVGTSLVTIVP